jgi:hypothetical protein
MNAYRDFKASLPRSRDRLSDEAYKAAFLRWFQAEADRRHLLKPHLPPYPIRRSDGCTFGLDIAKPCCAMHDLDYWFSETEGERKKADDDVRACMISIGEEEDRFGWFWTGTAAIYWFFVRKFGRPAISGWKK